MSLVGPPTEAIFKRAIADLVGQLKVIRPEAGRTGARGPGPPGGR
jgi:hypothetical protein